MSYTIQKFEINGSNINCLKFGEDKDKSFMMIPGMSLKSVMLSANAIASAYEEFTKDYCCYCLEVKSTKTGKTINEMADDLAVVMKKLELKDCYVLGVSLGGSIGMYLAINHPELIKRLVIASSSCRLTDKARDNIYNWNILAKAKNVYEINKSFLKLVYSPQTQKMLKESVDFNDGTIEDCLNFEVQSTAYLVFDISGRLNEIKCLTYVIGSNDDNVLGKEASLYIAEKLNCPIYMYDGYGHAVYDEASDYKQRLLDFYKD